eukprot:CAMPEP_0114134112 /NCGR_PEP_ID=MMETSP0043_2-20121206/13980_1 /TAXON_ID=464988 /ORGANISM="Hemiselmis andersenii, Strain CCMP644" /LENGTH=148 /DNA_ID=CAMNT_0001227723 /DNA_START=12 /DNA_END=458 /DNA_ORIENTATION=+
MQGVVLVHQHRHAHVLLLQKGENYFKLPGGKLKPGESEREGLTRLLTAKIGSSAGSPGDWEVGEVVSKWWRPNFDTALFPYLPPHITKPKEEMKQCLVRLPETCTFAIPTDKNLVAVPLFDLFDNTARYGPVIASLPQKLSRFTVNYV